MAKENKKGLSTDSNAYTIIYAALMVIIVAFLLSFVASLLRERQVNNEKLDKKKQILSAINILDDNADEAYAKYVKADLVLNNDGSVKSENGGFDVDFNKLSGDDNLPLYQCEVNGDVKYIVPLRGAGLWGPIWGYVSLNADKNTIYGIYFAHESETPGLGAEIVTDAFREPFKGKEVKKDGKVVSVAVLKKGVKAEGQDQVDAISGGTITSTGVNDMLRTCLSNYANFLTKEQ